MSKKTLGSLEKEKFLVGLGKTYAQELTVRATSWEVDFKAKLDSLGINYAFQYPVVCEKNYLYILDFYLPEYKIAFELDGAHHYEKAKLKADKQRTRRISKLGITVKRIRNRDVNRISPMLISNYLKQQLLKTQKSLVLTV